MFRRVLTLLMLTGVLAACQELPHPFADDRPSPHAPILTLSDTPGVLVEPVKGAPESAAAGLADAMVSAFQDQEIPASTATSNKSSYHLTGNAGDSRIGSATTDLRVHWILKNADGKTLGEDTEQASIAAPLWLKGNEAAFTETARSAVAKLSPLVTDVMPVEHKPTRQVFVRPVEGAPGNGRNALSGALIFLLKKHGVDVTPDPQATDTIAIAGDVSVAPVEPNQQHVQITWHIVKPDGVDAGQISQENTIPKGSIDGNWGDIAMAVAAAAVDDIIRVVDAVPPAS